MRAILFVVVIAACLFAKALIAHGQPEPKPMSVHNDIVLATGAESADQSPQAIADLLAEVNALRAAKGAGDKHGSAMAIAAIVAALGKFLIDWLKGLKAADLTDKAKAALPWLLSALGCLVAIAWRYGKGEDWTTSIIVGGGIPGMVLVHELLDAFKTLITKKPAARAPDIKPAPPAAPAALVLALVGLALGANGCAGGWAEFKADLSIVATDAQAAEVKCGAKTLNDLIAGIGAGASGAISDVVNGVEDAACIYLAIGSVTAANGGHLSTAQQETANKALTEFRVVKAKRAMHAGFLWVPVSTDSFTVSHGTLTIDSSTIPPFAVMNLVQ